jgi:ferric-dicitrate binding protein FerR (iron transport regulator)
MENMEQIDSFIIKYLSANISGEEQAILLRWLEESEENKVYFRSLKDAYDLGRLEFDIRDSQVKSQWNKFVKTITVLQPVKKWKSAGFSFMRYVAMFVLGILSIYLIHRFTGKITDDMITDTRIETGIGDKSKVTLPDGTVVWINSCSSVVYGDISGGKERSVYLKGEAYFDVKTDKQRPFMVRMDKLTCMVTGTSFNVYSFENEEESSIALLEGGVTIEYDHKSHILHPGELFIYNKVTNEFTVKNADVDLLSSWRRGEFVFDGMTFDELVNRLERLYNVKFIFENQKIRKETFGGTLRNYDSLETIMKVIKTSIPITYRIDENKVFIQ